MTQPEEKQKSEYELARDAAADRCAQLKKISGWGIDHLRLIEVFAEGADWGYERGKADGIIEGRVDMDRDGEFLELRQQLEAANELANKLADKGIELAKKLTAANAEIEKLKIERGTAQLAANALIEKLGAALENSTHRESCDLHRYRYSDQYDNFECTCKRNNALAQLEQWRKDKG